jgi:hypothetical protein
LPVGAVDPVVDGALVDPPPFDVVDPVGWP